ncbi:hypothetical protein Trydic_g9848 [Trypoxylus dichotomus]
MYADDVCIFTRSRGARIIDRCLQTALDILQAWYGKVENRRISREKRGRAFLEKWSPKKKARQPSRTYLAIPWRRQIKHLGVILDSRVNGRTHIRRVLNCGRQMSGTLHPLLIGQGKLDPTCTDMDRYDRT